MYYPSSFPYHTFPVEKSGLERHLEREGYPERTTYMHNNYYDSIFTNGQKEGYNFYEDASRLGYRIEDSDGNLYNSSTRCTLVKMSYLDRAYEEQEKLRQKKDTIEYVLSSNNYKSLIKAPEYLQDTVSQQDLQGFGYSLIDNYLVKNSFQTTSYPVSFQEFNF